MITLKSRREIDEMKEAGKILANTHKEIKKIIKPGITTWDLEVFTEEYLRKNGATPEQKGFEGYEYAICASINDEICHGFPRKQKLNEGDIVTVDMVVNYRGALADSAWTYAVGEIPDDVKHLMDVTHKALYLGIEQAKVGSRIGDIGHAIQTYVEAENLAVVREFIGHGVGPTLHEKPDVPHFGAAGKGPRLKEGMVITIEPMVNMGAWKAKMDDNGWTARTVDGSLSAQYEHTLAITQDGPEILTYQGEND
ncbi:type I methionyl aminopeptidase [Listeria ivanovii]|uniref:type I methionyl aminopeptidase n=1 Tax=Listeria ivanovii TaxID=1638 RepID=UPI000DA76E87|nr:type I methionyl aminopeptidase [Listeria ivanovii]PZF87133.1 type I methionyl aminopeptidase [Listeria ivanovii]PZF91939.1 type I methionyl aminopeptidase [Listeria ivanovii]PZG03239.1 type I methionyl aminopeptidase [Listeria ivanovii]PZG07385.1 type I methionyl aminopeptidase [Listeria ivanovii]PZG24459.1 type I methionyl aminopeptidase [Listeria ivanovii]